jgi:hypothetical protein
VHLAVFTDTFLSHFSLADSDDDVRSVSATCLLPILPLLADTLLDDEMAALLTTLWNCFSSDGDDLGSSTSAVMDLLCGYAMPRLIGLCLRIRTYPSQAEFWLSQR